MMECDTVLLPRHLSGSWLAGFPEGKTGRLLCRDLKEEERFLVSLCVCVGI